MATQYYSLPVPVATDYVKDGWDAIADLGTAVDSALAIPTYNNQTGTTYTFVLGDAAKVVSSNNASAVTFTVPPQSSVTWTTGATLTVANYGAGAVTIAGGSGVTVTNTAATIAQYSSATIIRTGSDAWTVIPFAGGAVGLISDSAISGTTGSPTTATYTSGGTNYKTYKFTGSGSITLSKAGLVDLMIISGGGGGADAYGGGGASAVVRKDGIYLSDTTHTIVIGAGGPQWNNGGLSSIDITTNEYLIIAPPGEPGNAPYSGYTGGHAAMRLDSTNLGKGGGAGNTNSGGGGGGVSGAGVNSTANYGGAGGSGVSNTFVTGSSQSYGGGGGGGGYSGGGAGGSGGGGNGGTNGGGAGTANTGGGGGGTWVGGGGSGGSGLVVIRVKA